MRRPVIALAAIVIMLAVAPGASMAAAGSPFPARIDLPAGWAPEGIAAGRGTSAFVGSLATGAIARVDLRTGAVNPAFIRGGAGQVAVGVDYEAGADRLWVAGGPTGEIRVYAASSGALLRSYRFAAGFVNDLVATHDAIIATDSVLPQLLVIPVGPHGGLPDPAGTFVVPIAGDLIYTPGSNANGIVEFAGHVLVDQTNTGALFAVSPASGASFRLLPDGAVSFADGMELVGSTLYIVRNQLNRIDRYVIHGATVAFQGSVASAGLDVPTGVAFAASQLWAVNARFNTPAAPDTPYWIDRLPRR